MKAFWNDCGRGVEPATPEGVDLDRARMIWFDEVRGVEGNFLGLVDEEGKVVQFMFDEGIPDDVDDAGHLQIVWMDYPLPERKGSYGGRVSIGEVWGLIERVFIEGADYRRVEGLKFVLW